jgi:hypothetical protein
MGGIGALPAQIGSLRLRAPVLPVRPSLHLIYGAIYIYGVIYGVPAAIGTVSFDPAYAAEHCCTATTAAARGGTTAVAAKITPSSLRAGLAGDHGGSFLTAGRGALRSAMIASSRRRSAGVTFTTMPALIPSA